MKGLSFVPQMAAAVLAGRKHQTRRVFSERMLKLCAAAIQLGECSDFLSEGKLEAGDNEYLSDLCDYVPGERRCLLTTWAVHRELDSIKPKALLAIRADRFWHAGTGPKPEWCGKSRPGRFLPNTLRHLMPVLEIVSVRVERVQDISEADALAEGAHCKIWITSPFSAGAMGARGERGTRREGFKEIWEDINGLGSWALNPYVWRIEFRKLP